MSKDSRALGPHEGKSCFEELQMVKSKIDFFNPI